MPGRPMSGSDMPWVHASVERLFLVLFGVARSAFLAQGLAFGVALLAVPWAGGHDAPAWLASTLRSCLMIGAVSFAAGIAMSLAPRLPLPRNDGSAEPAWPWPPLLGLSLVALPALAYASAHELAPLWREIQKALDAIGFWDVLAHADPFGGIVILPVLAALYVPALETGAAFFLCAVPLALLPLLVARSRLFPRLFAMLVACQAGLVIASLLGADAFSRLAAEASGAMIAAPDSEVQRVAEDFARAREALASTALAFVAPLLGYAAWLAVLLSPQRAGAFFTAGVREERASAPLGAPREPGALRTPGVPPAPPAALRVPAPTDPLVGATQRRARHALALLGAGMLVFAAADALRSRAGFASSQPEPGASLAASPAAIRVSFGGALDPSSSLSVASTFTHTAAVGVSEEVARSAGLAPDDPQRSTLEARTTGLPDGLYRVAWHAQPASGGVPRHGSFHFAVGMPVPEVLLGRARSLEERDAGARGRRHTVVGGALLIALGALLPRLARRG
jgi:methionine-rich copper-binding protein CopC